MVGVYYVPSGTARGQSLGLSDFPHWVPPPTEGPAVVIYSDILNESSVYADDGTLTSANWQSDPLYAKDAAKQAQTSAVAALAQLVSELGPALAQGKADLVTLASGTSDNTTLAAILARDVQGSLSIAQAVADILTALQLLEG